MRDDRELLREYLETKSEDAFRLLVERHAGMVHGAALRIVRDPALADEVCQAVFILLARKAATLPPGVVLPGWLHQATRFVARGALRTEFRRQQRHRELAAMNDPADSTTVADQITPHLDESLGELKAQDRDAIILRFLEGRSFAEVAAALGTTEAAAKMRVGRALDQLRGALGRHGVVVTLATLGPALVLHAAPAASAALLAQTIGAGLAASAPAPNLLPIVNEAIKLMALQKLKTSVAAVALSLLLIGGGITTVMLLPTKSTKSTSSVPPAEQPLIVTTFEPMAGEWEGTYEALADDEANPRRQRVALTVTTSNGGRVCAIEMHVLDRNERPVSTFHFSHSLNEKGDRIITIDDPHISTSRFEGTVTDSMYNRQTGEWRAALQATRPDSPAMTECRWSRQDDELFISRQDVTVTPQGTRRLSSELVLRPRSAKPRTAFNALPRGTQTFDGVTFLIRRPINIIGARAARAKGREFALVSEPDIHGRGKHIHVLHTGDHGSSATGDDIWRLVLHYADGGTERFDFAYDIHLRNFWRRDGDGPRTPSDPDTSLAWVGTSVESDQKGADLVVSRTTLANPRPESDVVGAEFVSLLGPSSAYVLSVTVSDGGPRPTGKARKTAREVPVFSFVVRDAAGAPRPETPVDFAFLGDDFSVRLAQLLPDDKGRLAVDVPVDIVRAIQYQARLPDGRTQGGEMEVVAEQKESRAHEIRLVE